MKTTFFACLLLAALPIGALAQHNHSGHTMPDMAKPGTSTTPAAPRKDSTRALTAKPAPVAGDTTKPRKTEGMPAQMDHGSMQHGGMQGMNHGDMGGMHHSNDPVGSIRFSPMGSMSSYLSRSLPMNRNGSGTSWMPDQTPMYAYMKHSPGDGKWMYMLHYSVFLRHTNQNFTNPAGRGREARIDAPNWAMRSARWANGACLQPS